MFISANRLWAQVSIAIPIFEDVYSGNIAEAMTLDENKIHISSLNYWTAFLLWLACVVAFIQSKRYSDTLVVNLSSGRDDFTGQASSIISIMI